MMDKLLGQDILHIRIPGVHYNEVGEGSLDVVYAEFKA
jgi:hypothetical protein